MSEYWANRQERLLNAISSKTEAEINAQLDKYYMTAMKQVLRDFEDVYNALMAQVNSGEQITVAHLYALDRYWQLQGTLRNLCEELGNKEVALLSRKFEEEWREVYEAAALPSDLAFTQVSTSNAEQMIKSIWVADGKTFSERVWGNVENLISTLNEHLVNVVVTGKSTTDLRNALMQDFQVSRRQANMLINTEINHIQTASAEKRYKDEGVEEYMFLGREKHKKKLKCDCQKLDGKIFRFDDPDRKMPPRHPNCACRIKPVMGDEILRAAAEATRKREEEKRAIKAEAQQAQKEAKQLREQARALKKEGKIEQAKQLEATARALEKKYKALYDQLNKLNN